MLPVNLQLYYRAGKTNIDADAQSRVSWLGCMPDTSYMHIQVTTAAVQAVQETAHKGSISPIEAYSSDVHVLDSVEESQQVACMAADDWHQAQQADPVLSLIIARLQDGTLSQCQLKTTSPPKLWQFVRDCSHLKLRWGILYRKTLPKDIPRGSIQTGSARCIQGDCSKRMPWQSWPFRSEMHARPDVEPLFWPCMAAQAKEHIEQCHPCLNFKVKQPRGPLENIVAIHLLKLVHLDYLFLEPEKGKEENILVVTDHSPPIHPGVGNAIADCPNNS